MRRAQPDLLLSKTIQRLNPQVYHGYMDATIELLAGLTVLGIAITALLLAWAWGGQP